MVLDAADPRTKRGAKLEKDKNTARSQAKIWLICLFLAIIFFISLRVADREPTAQCERRETCQCLDLFDAVYSIYVLVIFAYTACKVNLSCKVNKISMSRRTIKEKTRTVDMAFSVIFVILTSVLLFAFLKDT